MRNNLVVSNVHYHGANDRDIATGLIAFLDFVLNDAVLFTGVTLRRTRTGRLALSFPMRRERAIAAPIDDESREIIERQVFTALGLTTGPR